MATFLHNLMEGLRGREKFLEETMSDIVSRKKTEESYQAQYNALQKEIGEFKNKVANMQELGKDYNEHFERKIKAAHEQLEIKIDAWAKSWSDEADN